jgi:signal transduction histidine kinase
VAYFILSFSGKDLLKLPVYYIIFDLPEKRGLLLTAIIFIACALNAQQKGIDSLQTVIDNSVGIDKYEPLVNLTRMYAAFDNNKAVESAKASRNIALQFGDTSKIVRSSRMVGQLLNRIDQGKEAEIILSEVLPIARRNNIRNEVKNIMNNLAVAYTVQAKYDKALEMNFQTLILREQDKDVGEINVSLNNIGLVYFKLKNYPKALEYYTRSLTLLESATDKYFLDRLLVNIGLCYNQMKDFHKSQDFFDRAFKECGENCSDQIVMEGRFGLGISNYERGKSEEALFQFNESYSIAKKIPNKRFEAENLLFLARIYGRQHKNELAIDALQKCESIARSLGYNEILIETYLQFSSVYKQIENHERASYYQGQYINIKDSIYSGDLIKNLATVQTKFEERENLATIAANEEVIQRQRSLNIAIVIIAILASLLVFVLYRSNRVKKKVNAALSEAKAIIEDQNKQLLNSNIHLNEELKEKNIDLEIANESLRKVNDELDNFIYKTSHDIRGPLASLKGMCNVALIDVQDPLALDYLHKLDITADKLNTILTRLLIVNQINNSAIGHEPIDFDEVVNDVLLLEKKKGLPPNMAIRRHIGLGIEFYSDREFVRIILENLIDNAVKFYNDSKRAEPFVDIFVAEEKHKINIRVVDNGIGISKVNPDKIFQMFSRASERSETGGIGLYITKTAVEKLGGLIDLRTTSDGYTEFYIQLPRITSKVVA